MQFRRFVIGLSLLGIAGIGLSILRANEEPAAVPAQAAGADQVAQLVQRIEKLEARIKALETSSERATRQVNNLYVPSPQFVPMPVPEDSPVEVARPKARFLLLNGSK